MIDIVYTWVVGYTGNTVDTNKTLFAMLLDNAITIANSHSLTFHYYLFMIFSVHGCTIIHVVHPSIKYFNKNENDHSFNYIYWWTIHFRTGWWLFYHHHGWMPIDTGLYNKWLSISIYSSQNRLWCEITLGYF